MNKQRSIYYIVFFLWFFSVPLFSQISKRDSILVDKLRVHINEISRAQNKINNQIILIDELSHKFCFLTYISREDASKVLDIFLVSDLITKEERNKFLFKNISCFNEKEIAIIKSTLDSDLSPRDGHYFYLVSIYKLESQIEYLTNNTSVSLLEDIEDDLNNRKLSAKNIENLKNYSVLSNLGF